MKLPPLAIKLRPATLADVPLLEHWDQQEHVIACAPNETCDWAADLSQPEPPWRQQLIAELHGRPIGIVQIIDPHEEETHYWGDVAPNLRALDIWIGKKEDLGKGYGTRIMELTLAICFHNAEVVAVIIDPLEGNTAAIRFYERLGFAFVEKRQFAEDHCCIYRMTRQQWAQREAYLCKS